MKLVKLKLSYSSSLLLPLSFTLSLSHSVEIPRVSGVTISEKHTSKSSFLFIRPLCASVEGDDLDPMQPRKIGTFEV